MQEKITPTRSVSSTSPRPEERRSRERVPVRVPVKVRCEGQEHEGLTRDLSSSGIFLYSESAMEPGSKLELVIMLPAELGLGAGGWTLCQASVVRVEKSEGKRVGIAATLDRIAVLPEIS
jgi:PilZ domain